MNNMSDKYIGSVGYVLGFTKGIIDPSPTIQEKIFTALVLGVFGAFGSIIGKSIWYFVKHKVFKK